MKNQIIAFILLITYSLCTVTITTVTAGTCANSVYTFTLTGTTTEALGNSQTAAVTLSSPASTTPTCTIVSENPAAQGGRRLGAGDVTITCTISTALSGATITVSEVKVNGAAATIANLQQMSGTATCAGSSSGSGTGSGSGSGSGSTDEKKDSGNFIQLSRFLLMIILFAF